MAKAFGCTNHNTPIINIDSGKIHELKVIDEQHPLYGRTFKISFDQTNVNKTKLIRVDYKENIQLLISISSTNLHDFPKAPATKLTFEAVSGIILLFEEVKICPSKKIPCGKKSQIKHRVKY